MNEKYRITLEGQSPLLMHRDNLLWGERVKEWSKDPATKKFSVPGDDRTPAWSWLGYIYHDNAHLVIDSDNIMSMLRDGGKKCPAPVGRGSMKVQTQAGIICNELYWELKLKDGELVAYNDLLHLVDELDFAKHMERAESLGFELFVKRARIKQQKHVRVRPRFNEWSISGTLSVLDEQITKPMLQAILDFGGVYAGLCDWRPGSPTSPGQFGKFTAVIEEI